MWVHLKGSGGRGSPCTHRTTEARANAAVSERTRVGTGQPLSRGGSGGKTDLRQAGPRCITLQKSGTTTQAALTHMPVSPCTKTLHLQQDFLGGVWGAAGRQESSYNTLVEKMVPGKRSSRVTLKHQQGFGEPVPFLQWLRARGARGSWLPGKITQPIVQMEPCTCNRVISVAGP